MRLLCAALGDPHTRIPSVLIAGTNGKGSTAATLASILTQGGLRTGLYTSPHLARVNERIQISGPEDWNLVQIDDATFAKLYTRVDQAASHLVRSGKLPHAPSFFERLTAIAFSYYAGIDLPAPSPRADILVLEVGLGGRLDATNIVEPLITVLTDIALDHQDYLGPTITDIAREKCGILRRNGLLVTLSQHPEANQVIGEVAADLNVRGLNAATYLPPAERNPSEPEPLGKSTRNRYTLIVESEGRSNLLEVDSPLAGSHQQRNIALAIATALELRRFFGFNISRDGIERGIRKTDWPGRLEWLTPDLLLDVAHNPAGAWTLRAAITALPESTPRTLLFSCLRDKNLEEMARILFPLFDSSPDGDPARRRDHIVLSPVPSPRSATLEELTAAALRLGAPAVAESTPQVAIARARELTPPGGIIVATGSIYLVAEIRSLSLQPVEVPA
jgi:dihydrofolate synthase/folylpolyglutamate synthase